MQFLYSGLTSGSMYALVAIGFVIIYNTSGIINFAQGEFVMLGGMLMYTVFSMMGWAFLPAFAAAVILSFFLGILLDQSFIRFTRHKTEVNLIAVTVAGSIILRDVGMIFWGRDSLVVGDYIPAVTVELPGGVIGTQSLLVIGTCIFFALVLNLFLKKSRFGKAMRACFDDQTAARLCGIEVLRYRMLSFGIAAALGAVAGIVISPITYVTYTDGVMAGLKGFSAAVFGGLGSFWGAVAGGFLLGILESFAATVLPSGYKDAVAFVVILLVLFVRPAGLFGKKKVHRV